MHEPLFIQACRGTLTERIPVWLMRQAGRYMPAYRKLREEHTILDLIKSPELAADVTMQPMEAFGMDAAIIFADILTLPEAMGMPLEFIKGSGPHFDTPVRSLQDVKALHPITDPARTLSFTMEALTIARGRLAADKALIGFSGAPFTLACYMIEGQSSRDFASVKKFMFQQPEAWELLMEKLTASVAGYLLAQVKAGADAVQLFDSWVGQCSPQQFATYVLPGLQSIIASIRASSDAPIVYFSTGTGGWLELLQETGADVISVDWRVPLDEAARRLHDVSLQGNLDPVLLADAPAAMLREEALKILESMRTRPGYIFNLGHGVLKHTPEEHVQLLVETVQQFDRQGVQA